MRKRDIKRKKERETEKEKKTCTYGKRKKNHKINGNKKNTHLNKFVYFCFSNFSQTFKYILIFLFYKLKSHQKSLGNFNENEEEKYSFTNFFSYFMLYNNTDHHKKIVYAFLSNVI